MDGKSEFEETLKANEVIHYKSEQMRMRHLVVKGILESEKSYLHVIDQLVKVTELISHFLMLVGS